MFNPFKRAKDRLENLIRSSVEKSVINAEKAYTQKAELEEEITLLKRQLENLKLEKDRKDEEYLRREREVTHKLGLERMRQEQEAEAHKKQITLEIREGNLVASEKQFKDQMEFQRKQLQDQIGSLQVLVEKVFEKIPDVKHETTTVITQGQNVKRLKGK